MAYLDGLLLGIAIKGVKGCPRDAPVMHPPLLQLSATPT